jgi:hypothetical protein
MISTAPSLCLIYHFPNPFLKITWFREESPYIICRQLVPELCGPIYKEIFFDISPLLSAPNFPIMIDPGFIGGKQKKVIR